jgi:hypothetical protein
MNTAPNSFRHMVLQLLIVTHNRSNQGGSKGADLRKKNMLFDEPPPKITKVHICGTETVALTSYEWAILHRLVAGQPVILTTPEAQ